MKKIVPLLLVVTALAVTTPSFAQNYGANNHLEEMTPQKFFQGIVKPFELFGEWFSDAIKGSHIGEHGYMGPDESEHKKHTPSAKPEEKKNKQTKQESQPKQKKETPKSKKTSRVEKKSCLKSCESDKAYLKNQIKRSIARQNIA